MHPILDAPDVLRAAFWVLAAFVLMMTLLILLSIAINTPILPTLKTGSDEENFKKALRVMTWNVRDEKSDKILSDVIRLNPDILALQGFDITSNIREPLYDKYKHVLKCDTRFGSNVIFSQYNISDSTCIDIDDRVCCKTIVDYLGKRIAVYCVHLENSKQLTLLEMAEENIILLGDFGSVDKKIHSRLKKDFTVVSSKNSYICSDTAKSVSQSPLCVDI